MSGLNTSDKATAIFLAVRLRRELGCLRTVVVEVQLGVELHLPFQESSSAPLAASARSALIRWLTAYPEWEVAIRSDRKTVC